MNEWTGLKFCDAVREAENKKKWRERVATSVAPQRSLTTGQVQGASQYPDNKKCPMHPYALPSILKIKFCWRKDLNRTYFSTQLSLSFFFLIIARMLPVWHCTYPHPRQSLPSTMSSSDHEPMPFALCNIYLLLIPGVFRELVPLHRAGVVLLTHVKIYLLTLMKITLHGKSTHTQN